MLGETLLLDRKNACTGSMHGRNRVPEDSSAESVLQGGQSEASPVPHYCVW